MLALLFEQRGQTLRRAYGNQVDKHTFLDLQLQHPLDNQVDDFIRIVDIGRGDDLGGDR